LLIADYRGNQSSTINNRRGGFNAMYAVEFQAKVQNGIIEIPARYRDQIKQRVRVIVLAEPDDKPSNLIDQLLETRFWRPFGLGRGEFSVPDDFDVPLPEQIEATDFC
jgi:hypothetical protein